MLFKRGESKFDFWHNEKVQEGFDFAVEIVKIVIISLAIIIPVRYFLIQPFYVKGASMEPNFYNHEYLIIDEISYRFGAPQRGDVVVFHPPSDPRGDYFIKRIIGLPGEKIEIKDGQIEIFNPGHSEGVVLDESMYLGPSVTTQGQVVATLKADEYFLVGDNRSASMDSRSFGPVNRDKMVGRVWLRGWPFDRITIFSTPEYNLN